MTNPEPIPISVFGSAPEQAEQDKIDEDIVTDLVRNHVLRQARGPYRQVNVSIERRPDASPARLTVYLLRSDTYTAEVVHVDVDPSYGVERLVYDEPQ